MLTIGAIKYQNQMIDSDLLICIVIVVTYAESKVNIAVKFNVGSGYLPPSPFEFFSDCKNL